MSPNKFQIPLSAAVAAFGSLEKFNQAVMSYVAALSSHRFAVGEPAPVAPHALVERAVARVQYPVDAVHQPTRYEPVTNEDTGETTHELVPAGEPVKFMSSIRPDEFVSHYTIIDDTPAPPTLSERKAALEVELLAQAEARTQAVIPSRKRMALAMDAQDAQAQKKPTAAHKAVIADFEDRQAKLIEINRHLARQLSDLDDLTDETIDGWKPAPFPE